MGFLAKHKAESFNRGKHDSTLLNGKRVWKIIIIIATFQTSLLSCIAGVHINSSPNLFILLFLRKTSVKSYIHGTTFAIQPVYKNFGVNKVHCCHYFHYYLVLFDTHDTDLNPHKSRKGSTSNADTLLISCYFKYHAPACCGGNSSTQWDDKNGSQYSHTVT